MTRQSISIRRFLSIALLLLAIVAGPLAVSAQSPVASPGATSTAGGLYADIIPSMADQIRLQTDGQLPVYRVTGNLVPASEAPGRIEGSLQLSYINVTDESQSELYLRLYPNFKDYGGGSMTLSNVTVDGQPVEAGDRFRHLAGHDRPARRAARAGCASRAFARFRHHHSRTIRSRATACSAISPTRSRTTWHSGCRCWPDGIRPTAGCSIRRIRSATRSFPILPCSISR